MSAGGIGEEGGFTDTYGPLVFLASYIIIILICFVIFSIMESKDKMRTTCTFLLDEPVNILHPSFILTVSTNNNTTQKT